MTSKKVFTYEEALRSFPRVRQLTIGAVRQVEALYKQNSERETSADLVAAIGDLAVRRDDEARPRSPEAAADRSAELEASVAEIVRQWSDRVIALGCEVKGLWLVDWDNGDGYYCWRYPEESISHYHGYDEGFAGRVPIN